MMKLVNSAPRSQYVFTGEIEVVVVVGLTINGFRFRAPDAKIRMPRLTGLDRSIRTGVKLSATGASSEFVRQRENRVHVIQIWLPSAGQVFPVVRDAIEAYGFNWFDCNLKKEIFNNDILWSSRILSFYFFKLSIKLHFKYSLKQIIFNHNLSFYFGSSTRILNLV